MNLAERFAIVYAETRKMTDDVSSEDPHFYAMHKLHQAAQKAIEDGLMVAGEIISAANAVERAHKESKPKP